MSEFLQDIKVLATLFCIERRLNHITPQFQKDAFNAVVAVEKENVFQVDWQSFTSPDEIPTEVIYIQFWDNNQVFLKDAFVEFWGYYSTYFNDVFRKKPWSVPADTQL